MIDFSDLISRKEVLRAIAKAIQNIPPAVATEEKPSKPRSLNYEDVEEWEREQGIRSFKDRHHL